MNHKRVVLCYSINIGSLEITTLDPLNISNTIILGRLSLAGWSGQLC